MLQMESRVYRLKGLTPLLGSSPASRAIRTQYIASRAPSEELRAEEEANPFDSDEKGVTVFMRDGQDHLCLMGYQIKGFFKGALNTLRPQLEIAAAKSKVDTMLFVEPRYIPVTRGGEMLVDEDEMLERPIRTEGPKGVRVALQSSELIEDPWEVEIEISLLPSRGSAKSNPLNWDAVETALDYGAYHGLGQWRNADYGRFIWERIDDDD